MYFLLDTCQHPTVLRTIYFAIIIRDIIFTVIPIGIIVMMFIDFSKAVIAGKEDEQQKAVKLIPKRIMYALITFSIPWIINILMKTLEGVKIKVAMDYNTCITNAENAEGNFDFYDNLLEAEEKAEQMINDENKGDDYSTDDLTLDSIIANNIYQSDSKWGSYPLCTNKSRVGKTGDNRTISLAGCGFCSLTMILRTYEGNNITPDSVVEQVCSIGYGKSGHAAPSDFAAIAKKHGLKSKVYYVGINPKDDFVKTFEPLLKEGKRLIVNMPDHYISVLGIRKDGYLYVGDSSLSRDYSKKGPYSLGGLYDTITKKGPLLNVTAIWKE